MNKGCKTVKIVSKFVAKQHPVCAQESGINNQQIRQVPDQADQRRVISAGKPTTLLRSLFLTSGIVQKPVKEPYIGYSILIRAVFHVIYPAI